MSGGFLNNYYLFRRAVDQLKFRLINSIHFLHKILVTNMRLLLISDVGENVIVHNNNKWVY